MNSVFDAKRIHAVIGGSNFSGSWRVYQSLQDAQRFEELLKTMGVPTGQVTTLYSRQYTRAKILSSLRTLVSTLKSGDIAVIYFAGHGTQVADRPEYIKSQSQYVLDESDGMDEALQTDDRLMVTDDELSAEFVTLGRDQPKNSDFRVKVITIADTCHSPSLDMWRFDGLPVDVISIKAALDNQSALQSGDGSYMSAFLFPILRENPQIKINDLQEQLESKMREGFAGTMQLSKIETNMLKQMSLF